MTRHTALSRLPLRTGLLVALTLALPTGCYRPIAVPGIAAAPGVAAPAVQNPVFIAGNNSDVFWEALVDVLDDYFRIVHEDRVRQVGDVLTEGRIDMYPKTGATVLEPWRKDSVGRFQRWESTLQTIRRRAQARVIPTAGGFLVEVIVEKELEALDRPEHATAASAGLRLGETIDRQPAGSLRDDPHTLGWIPLGRDTILEQTILMELTRRVGAAQPAAPTY
jgi:hypothetical protein